MAWTFLLELLQHHQSFRKWYERVTNGNGVVEVLKFRPTDVLIVGPPKSGTTWLQQIFHQIRTGGDEYFTDIYDVTKICPKYISGFPGYQIDGEQMALPRVFKGHSSFEQIPTVDGVKMVVVVRDPLDTVWSMSKFASRFYGLNQALTCDDLTKLFELNAIDFPPPWEFVNNWYPHKNDPNVLWIHYEDLIKDLKFCIAKLSDFIGVKLGEGELERIYNFCTFAYMSSHLEMFSGGDWFDAFVSLSDNPKPSRLGMVSPDGGKVGQGGKDLPEDMKEFVMAAWKETVEKSLGFSSYQQLYEQNSLLRK